jgi:hypothetical protein
MRVIHLHRLLLSLLLASASTLSAQEADDGAEREPGLPWRLSYFPT